MTRLANDQSLVDALLATFIHQWQSLREELGTCIEERELKKLSRVAHTMKGAAANLEAARIRELSLLIEKLAAAGQLDDVCQLVPELDEQYRLFLETCGQS